MATQTATMNGVPKRPTPRAAPVKRPATTIGTGTKKAAGTSAAARNNANKTKAASVAGGERAGGGPGVTGAYAIMASRIANRVAEMAESITFVERPKPEAARESNPNDVDERKRPRKLEMRLQNGGRDSVAFSAPFLDNTLQKMLGLQNRMLKSTAELSKAENVEERIIKEHAAQSAELSRIIALICAEKARQGA